MQSEWAPAHCDVLRKMLAGSQSYSEIAAALNAIFHTTYSRSAVIGRAKRMGLAGTRPDDPPKPLPARPASLHRSREHHGTALSPRMPILEAVEPVRLRCADIDPRHLSLADLQVGDCRYPYGGDEEGEPITFCGHPRHENSSYCTAHFKLTRDTEAAPAAASGDTARRPWRPHDRSMRTVAIPTRLPRRLHLENVVSLLDFKLQYWE
jgi:GcrA cell cycle regulator